MATAIFLSLAACGGLPDSDAGSKVSELPDVTVDETPVIEEETVETPEPTTASETRTLSVDEFENLLSQMPVHVISTKYTVQDEQYKSLYPDILQAVLQNDTSYDIKNAVVAFVAWDKNNLPVKIKGTIDFSDGAYIKQVNYSDINLVPGSTYGETSGYQIDETCGIQTFKAVVVSFETFDSDIWENPYYDEWCKLYEGVKYTDDLKIDVAIEDAGFEPTAQNADQGDSNIMEDELVAEIESQEFRVISTKYVVQDTKYKSLYPDMLQAVLQNDTSYDIKNAVVAFVAWDKNNLPVKIKGSIDFSDGSYIKLVNYNDINMIPGATYGESSGYEVDDACGIQTFKAVVVSYETFDGVTWQNPLYDDWCKLYEGVKLK